MKKFFRTTAMMLALSMMLGISAMAAPPTINNVEGQEASFAEPQDNKIGSVTYENNKIVEGGQYMIFVSTAAIPTQSSLLYINQAEGEDGEVTFENVYPKQMKTSKVLVSGTGLGGLQHILDILAQLLLGYITDDDQITTADAQEILRFAASLDSLIEDSSSKWLELADINGDGLITAADAQEILKYAADLDSILDDIYGE